MTRDPTVDLGEAQRLPDHVRQRESTLRYLLAFLADWAIIVVTISFALHARHWAIYILAVFVVGTRQHALAILGHDGAHYLIARHRTINDAMANILAFWPIGFTCEGYRAFHMRHHAHTADDRHDPERFILRGWFYAIPTGPGKFAGMFLFDLLGGGIFELGRILWATRPGSWRAYLGAALFWSVIVVLAWRFDLWIALGIWVASLLTALYAVFRVRTWSEHQGLAATHRFRANAILRFIFWPHNTHCHYEHHRWPHVSCFRLPEARKHDDSVPIVGIRDLLAFFAGDRNRIAGLPLSEHYPASTRTENPQTPSTEPAP